MSTVENGKILLYCHFNKIIKGPGTSFPSRALSQKYVRNVCHTAHQYLTKFHFDSTWESKEISINVTSLCSNAYDYVTDFEIWISQKNTKIQISREQNLIFSSNKKKFINYLSKATLWQKIVLQRR